ncbi:SAM-dependent methyltransferase [Rubritalea marina]|uniref:SAM-dependent methyltransferase n=1 Tax=Rubritalea marina TaxID=361055 RepID=UPI00036CFF55|nr:SAM-dependent methyltransferase [Rubritalea marina]
MMTLTHSSEAAEAKVQSLLELMEQLISMPRDFALATPLVQAMADGLAELTGVSVEEEMLTRDDAETQHGVAISPVQAAKCLKEPLRTQVFMQGVKQAIEDALAANERVRILYAGTGPYGLLLLPLVARYFREAPLDICLIDIHARNVSSIQHLVSLYGIEERVVSVDEADATLWQPSAIDAFDILISETMTAMLRREPQVKIFAHLEQFLKPEGVLIPQEIQIHASLESNDGNERVLLGHVFTLSRETAQAAREERMDAYQGVLEVPDGEGLPTRLCVETDLKVYGEHWLRRNECSLNMPIYVDALYFGERRQIPFHYDFSESPDFIYDTPHYQPDPQLTSREDRGSLGLMHLKRFWHKVQLDKAGRLDRELRSQEFDLDFTLVQACGGQLQQWYEAAYSQHPPDFESFEAWVQASHALDAPRLAVVNDQLQAPCGCE